MQQTSKITKDMGVWLWELAAATYCYESEWGPPIHLPFCQIYKQADTSMQTKSKEYINKPWNKNERNRLGACKKFRFKSQTNN